MASTSSSRSLWDPYTVLDVNPKDPNCTCVGFGTYKQKRCGFPLHKTEQFDPSQRITAIKCLETMSQMHPSSIDPAALTVLAENTLCRDWHRYQAFDKCNEWKARIELYIHERGLKEAPVRGLKYEITDARSLKSGIAKKDSDAVEQEIKKARLALEKVKAELEDSETRCSGLIDKNGRLETTHSRETASLTQQLTESKQQLTASRKRTRNLEQQVVKVDEGERLRTRVADEKDEEIARLKMQMEGRNAEFERDGAARDREIEGLKARVRDVEGLNRRWVEDAAQVPRLQEQERKVEQLTRQMEAVSRELEVREVGFGTFLEFT